MIDYAKPLINMEYMTRIIHDACLKQDFENAQKIAVELQAEVKMFIHTLTLMIEEREKQEAARRAVK
jgi:hypothetical protein